MSEVAETVFSLDEYDSRQVAMLATQDVLQRAARAHYNEQSYDVAADKIEPLLMPCEDDRRVIEASLGRLILQGVDEDLLLIRRRASAYGLMSREHGTVILRDETPEMIIDRTQCVAYDDIVRLKSGVATKDGLDDSLHRVYRTYRHAAFGYFLWGRHTSGDNVDKALTDPLYVLLQTTANGKPRCTFIESAALAACYRYGLDKAPRMLSAAHRFAYSAIAALWE